MLNGECASSYAGCGRVFQRLSRGSGPRRLGHLGGAALALVAITVACSGGGRSLSGIPPPATAPTAPAELVDSAPFRLSQGNVRPGDPYWTYVPMQRAASNARLRPLDAFSSTTVDECFYDGVECFEQDHSDVGGGWSIVCNGDQTCMSTTWKLALVAPTGVTSSFSPAIFAPGTYSVITMKVPKTMAVGTSSLVVSFTQVSGTTLTAPGNSTVPIQTLCTIADSTCPAIHIQDVIPSPSVLVDGKTTSTAAGWPMQLKIVPTSPPGLTYTVSSPTWNIPNSPLASYSAITGATPVPLPMPTQATTPVFYWTYPAGWGATGPPQAITATAKLTRTNQEIADTGAIANYVIQWPSPPNMAYSNRAPQVSQYNAIGGIYLSYGDLLSAADAGMIWKYQASAPAITGGYFSLIQLVALTTQVELNASPPPATPFPTRNTPANPTTGGSYWLDGCPIYAAALHGSPGASVTLGAGYDDSPGFPLANISDPSNTYYMYSEVDAKYAFEDYYVFRPDRPSAEPKSGPPSIWITIGEQEWSWGATSTITMPQDKWSEPYWVYGSAPPGGQTNATLSYSNTMPSLQSCPPVPAQS